MTTTAQHTPSPRETVLAVLAVFDAALPKGELAACKAAMNALKVHDPERFAELNRLADTATFERRHYGGGQCYTWFHLPGQTGTHDPWPASTFPRAALLWTLFSEDSK